MPNLSEKSLYIIEDFCYTLKTQQTKNDYKREIIRFMEHIEKDFLNVTRIDCERYVEFLKTKVHDKEFSTATAEKKVSYLMSFFNHIEKNKEKYQLPEYFCNHFKNISKPAASRDVSLDKIISLKELDKLIHVAKNNLRNYTTYMLIFTTGIKLKELLNLKWIQFIEDREGNVGIELMNDDNSIRYIKVHPDVWQLLLQYKEISKLENPIYVFHGPKGQKLTARTFQYALQKDCEEAGIPKYTLSDLRHSHIYYSLNANAPKELIAQQQNWSNILYVDRYKKYENFLLKESPFDFVNFSLKTEND